MSSWARPLFALALAAIACGANAQAAKFPGIGRDATSAEVKAWDIDVRPDFHGLPPGSGSVARGQQVWEDKCASCHGVFGESNSVFNPLVGGTTRADIEKGRVANLQRPDYPGRTTMMKLPTLSTLWDYINRAMPWNQPKSLSVEEVYAVTAYMLNLADVVPADFTLSDRNIAQVQQRLPNRNGMSSAHAMWPGKELRGTVKPDVTGSACMKDCAVEPRVASLLPPHARNAHGNLAEQNRGVGPQRGADTRAAGAAPAVASAAPADGGVSTLLQKNNCTACHAAGQRIIGPSWAEVAQRHAGKADYLAGKIRGGSSGVWGNVPMPPQALDEAAARQVADWLANGAK
ncbi:c-type cytochrome [Ramlibacter henchirensis]|uniref:C-type cytochrome n=1 Tax=Ramlibacter henchirensis TaxID=204072 RepID=A0A4Z0C9U5_9BURK|nr:c-type cytochrome [Ramlibacter henchirensis]TFZ07170.1 c-type cytochrome [Ramlibacter henchirensis]